MDVDASGQRTAVFRASVWRASVPSAAAVVVAALVTVMLVRWRGRAPRTAEQRAAMLTAAWAPVVLLGWVAWSVFLTTSGPHVYRTEVTFGPYEPPDRSEPFMAFDHLDLLSLPGYAEGPAWGLFVAVPLVVAVALWATTRTLMRTSSPR